MKKLSRKMAFLLVVSILFSIVMILPSMAASGAMEISVSSATVSVGDTFTVTVKYNGDVKIANAEWCLNYNTNFVSYEGMNGKIPSRYDSSSLETSEKSFSQTYSFKAVAVGDAGFSISDYFAIPILPEDGDLVEITAGTGSVKVIDRGSNDANLSSLKISSGTLKPAFSKDVTSYTVDVPYSVSSLSISAAANDAKAKVSLSGSDTLNVGANTRVVIVTAEDGTVKKYTITIKRAQSVQNATPTPSPAPTPTPDPNEENVLEVNVNGTILTISQKPGSIALPDNFEEITYKYKGKDVWAAKSKAKDVVLFYMLDAGHEKSGFYVYDMGNETFYRFISIPMEDTSYAILQPSVNAILPTGFYEKTAKFSGAEMTVWVPEADRYSNVEDCRYLLVYAMRKDGKMGFYIYDTEETSFLHYSESFFSRNPNGSTPLPMVTPDPNGNIPTNPENPGASIGVQCKAYFDRLFGGKATGMDWLMTVFFILFIVLLMVLVVFIVYVAKQRKAAEAEYEEEMEYEDEEPEKVEIPQSVPEEVQGFRRAASLEEYEVEVPEEPETEEPIDEVEEEPEQRPLDFTIADLEEESLDFADLEKDEEIDNKDVDGWQLDEKLFDDFFNPDDKKE